LLIVHAVELIGFKEKAYFFLNWIGYSGQEATLFTRLLKLMLRMKKIEEYGEK
jgi:hypothetical protein